MRPSVALIRRVLREELEKLHEPTYVGADDVPILREAVRTRLGVELADHPQREDQPVGFRTIARHLQHEANS